MLMKFLSKHKVLVFIVSFVLVYILSFMITEQLIEKRAAERIEDYIKAQGLTHAEKIEDTGVIYGRSIPIIERKIIFKDNPTMRYVYFTGNKEYTSIYDYINPFYNLKENLNGSTEYYKGVAFYSYNYKKEEDYVIDQNVEDNTMEGFVDKEGNLLEK
ncbi:MAG: DUF3139 domain-containing protein [Miniphocaeibacter sp.]|uniref:hypothetical protein n=1 Tax=Miniphocaeibacter sp. TaxID=3100973 RepID=UPI0018145CCE|nr:DUF3139 domain-containing protein [Gallicola sp.]